MSEGALSGEALLDFYARNRWGADLAGRIKWEYKPKRETVRGRDLFHARVGPGRRAIIEFHVPFEERHAFKDAAHRACRAGWQLSHQCTSAVEIRGQAS